MYIIDCRYLLGKYVVRRLVLIKSILYIVCPWKILKQVIILLQITIYNSF